MLTFVGMFKDPRLRERVDGPRDTWRCKSCGWSNVFQAVGVEMRADIQLKRAG